MSYLTLAQQCAMFSWKTNLVPLPIQLLEFDEDEQPRHMS